MLLPVFLKKSYLTQDTLKITLSNKIICFLSNYFCPGRSPGFILVILYRTRRLNKDSENELNNTKTGFTDKTEASVYSTMNY